MSDAVFGEFVWDPDKAASNLRDHGVSFFEAMTVWADPNAILRPDHTTHGNLIAIGYSSSSRVLFVVHCERGDLTRIISARRASATQAREYRDG